MSDYFERAARLYCKEVGIEPDEGNLRSNWYEVAERMKDFDLMRKCLLLAQDTKLGGNKKK